jgi:hypothetical protein
MDSHSGIQLKSQNTQQILAELSFGALEFNAEENLVIISVN